MHLNVELRANYYAVCLKLSETSLDSHRGILRASLPCKVNINCTSSSALSLSKEKFHITPFVLTENSHSSLEADEKKLF